jgi:hypothetical protein
LIAPTGTGADALRHNYLLGGRLWHRRRVG